MYKSNIVSDLKERKIIFPCKRILQNTNKHHKTHTHTHIVSHTNTPYTKHLIYIINNEILYYVSTFIRSRKKLVTEKN